MILALTGGIGGAKLALGLSRVLPPTELTLAVNTGDDFEHLGLAISPDIDTLMYTLAGQENPQTGWGCRDETWQFMSALESLGGETWFRLGDRDLATHVERTRRLRGGEALSVVTADFCARLGIGCRVLPMSDDPVRTRVGIRDGGEGDEVRWLDFQDYFVRRRCEPAVTAIRYEGAESARPLPALLATLSDPALRAVVVCPSNPWLSIDPMLAMPALRSALARCAAPIIAVSPIISGRAVKGPTAKIMAELGMGPSAAAVARHYGALIDVFVVNEGDAADAGGLGDGEAVRDGPRAGAPSLITPQPGLAVVARRTLMTSLADREGLASAVLELARGAVARAPRPLPR